jgi:hypothetical protein
MDIPQAWPSESADDRRWIAMGNNEIPLIKRGLTIPGIARPMTILGVLFLY